MYSLPSSTITTILLVLFYLFALQFSPRWIIIIIFFI